MDKIINWDVDPVIFQLTDSFPIKYYGLLFGVGIFLGFLIVKNIYKKEKIPVEQLDNLFIYIVLGTL